jgi:hypothetical protein
MSWLAVYRLYSIPQEASVSPASVYLAFVIMLAFDMFGISLSAFVLTRMLA